MSEVHKIHFERQKSLIELAKDRSYEGREKNRARLDEMKESQMQISETVDFEER